MDQRDRRIVTRLTSGPVVGAAIGMLAASLVASLEHTALHRAGNWAFVAVVAAGTIGGAALVRAHRRLSAPGELALLQCCIAAAGFGCVPETDQYKGVGILVLGVLLLEVVARERLPLGWHAFVLGASFWAAVFGASGRGSAVVGAVFSIWPLCLVAIAWRGHTLAAGAGVAASWLVSRTGAIQASTAPAWWAVLLWGGLSVAVASFRIVRATSGTVRHQSRTVEH